ncbi:hypothetical protein STSP2_01134 [Anaerohalosphaera lusitana]|uniref:DUF1540 domain-containing protein n=1 Tax=Anaerohalosphaera lusitana TaxID=1936003 RepID=A0A1U9NK71_9BACT|nr:DUF1540 domain-containing protein [Anaerohalosphaera lusitana]AQT67980.1 hypothetical protein STSP2_01134 [Anaerohalosphaera lusitana]
MQMSKVSKCDVTGCAYNTDNQCHAYAITIGNSGTPKCDTLCMASGKTDDTNSTAGVGACKTTSCKANKGFECTAPEITVGFQGNEADCLSFTPR